MTPKQRAAKAIDDLGIHDFVMPCESARAALSAIAEPSEAMIEAGNSYLEWCCNHWEEGTPPSVAVDVGELYRIMHAAMMAEKETGE